MKAFLSYNKIICLLFIILCSTLYSYSQNVLILSNPHRTKRIRYHNNDGIDLLTITGRRITGTITQIEPNSIQIDGLDLNTKYIAVVYKEHVYIGLFKKLFGIAGAGYFVIGSFNNAINGNDVVTKQEIIPAATMLATAGIFWFFETKKYKIGKPWSISVAVF